MGNQEEKPLKAISHAFHNQENQIPIIELCTFYD